MKEGWIYRRRKKRKISWTSPHPYFRSLGDNRLVGRSGERSEESGEWGRQGGVYRGYKGGEGDSLSRGQERLSWAQPRMLWGQAEVSGGDRGRGRYRKK